MVFRLGKLSWGALRNKPRILSSRAAVSKGFGRKYAAPSSEASASIRSETKPETRMVIGASPCFCSCRSTLMPSMPGSITSITRRSGIRSFTRFRISFPSRAISTENSPVFSISSHSSVRNSSPASASNTVLR